MSNQHIINNNKNNKIVIIGDKKENKNNLNNNNDEINQNDNMNNNKINLFLNVDLLIGDINYYILLEKYIKFIKNIDKKINNIICKKFIDKQNIKMEQYPDSYKEIKNYICKKFNFFNIQNDVADDEITWKKIVDIVFVEKIITNNTITSYYLESASFLSNIMEYVREQNIPSSIIKRMLNISFIEAKKYNLFDAQAISINVNILQFNLNNWGYNTTSITIHKLNKLYSTLVLLSQYIKFNKTQCFYNE